MRTPFWLKNPQKVRQNGQLGASMVTTVESLEIARKICADGLRFGGIRHRADLYWEVEPDAICPCCCGLGHQGFKACGEREPRCYVCGGPHIVQNIAVRSENALLGGILPFSTTALPEKGPENEHGKQARKNLLGRRRCQPQPPV
ncbi:hypothetical protein ACJ73_10290 [Blastomyces percursus]|uniref:Uncharacterized protein n=1 Tax=Blastomyces percursus TaxID=1658174 RepID=A0A1J9Q2S2_9EURO|nr:hypothetical protein ACJ73_10290 [Blastomyces percursus]